MVIDMQDKRYFRAETFLNAAEEIMLNHIAGKFGVSKSAAIRICLHHVGDHLTQQAHAENTGIITEV